MLGRCDPIGAWNRASQACEGGFKPRPDPCQAENFFARRQDRWSVPKKPNEGESRPLPPPVIVVSQAAARRPWLRCLLSASGAPSDEVVLSHDRRIREEPGFRLEHEEAVG